MNKGALVVSQNTFNRDNYYDHSARRETTFYVTFESNSARYVCVFIERLVYILHNHQSRFLVVNKYVM